MAKELTYFSLLGINESTSQEELEARYRELAEFLTSPALPAHLRDWATTQAALVDEAYAVLADPERRAAVDRGREQAAKEVAPAPARRRAKAESGAEGKAATRAAAGPRSEASRTDAALRGVRAHPVAVGAVVGVVALAAIVLFQVGLPGDGGAEQAPPAQQTGDLVPLDQARVAELLAAVEEDPENMEALFELGESYFLAGEWQSAIDWFTKLVALDTKNVHALTDIGTANYNLGFPQEAKASWLKALDIDANDPQVHYNLGFLYANAEPQDLAAAMREWQTVMELAPDSDLARTVQVHLEGLAMVTPEASPAAP